MTGCSQETLSKEQIVLSNFSHQGYALIGTTLILFEVVFLILYVDSFWLAVDLLPWGIPTIVAAAVLANWLLSILESPQMCRALAPIFKRRPPLIYRRWLAFDETSITFGAKRVVWDVIDEVDLTLFGNLVLKTRQLCGAAKIEKEKDKNPADVIFKAPLGAISLQSQKDFVGLLQRKKPEIVLNARLKKQLNQPLLKGMALLQGTAVFFLAAVLIDFGYSNFRYLELLKQYYLSEQNSLLGTTSSAGLYYQRGEAIRLHPLAISWISNKVMNAGKIAAGIDQVRSETLWHLGRKDEALKLAQEAVEQAPKSFSFRLRLARLYTALSNDAGAKEEITKAAEDHKDSLLPRFYMLSLLLDKKQTNSAREYIDGYEKHLNEEVFTPPPIWPPGEEPFLHELFNKDDLDFIFQRLLK